MDNQFCRYLSNGYSFSSIPNKNAVAVRPCCLFDDYFVLGSDLENNRARYHQIQDWIPECNRCKFLENSNQQSLRQTGPHWIDNSRHTHPVTIDINLDNTCNAACVICDSWSSTLWQKEEQKLNRSQIPIYPQIGNVDEKIQQIVEAVDLSHVRYVKFFGGEPLFTDTHIKFLEKLPNPEQVTVHYTTNGSIFPNARVQELWSKFRTIIFSASLDGTESQFNYVRWPLPWHKVSENLTRLKDKNLHNVMFRVEFTVNFLNAWYYDRLEHWVNTNWSHNNHGDKTEINLHRCTGVFELQRMPQQLRQIVMEKYPTEHVIHSMIANLEEPLSLNPFFEFVNLWDPRRQLSWQQAFCDIDQYIFGK